MYVDGFEPPTYHLNGVTLPTELHALEIVVVSFSSQSPLTFIVYPTVRLTVFKWLGFCWRKIGFEPMTKGNAPALPDWATLSTYIHDQLLTFKYVPTQSFFIVGLYNALTLVSYLHPKAICYRYPKRLNQSYKSIFFFLFLSSGRFNFFFTN